MACFLTVAQMQTPFLRGLLQFVFRLVSDNRFRLQQLSLLQHARCFSVFPNISRLAFAIHKERTVGGEILNS